MSTPIQTGDVNGRQQPLDPAGIPQKASFLGRVFTHLKNSPLKFLFPKSSENRTTSIKTVAQRSVIRGKKRQAQGIFERLFGLGSRRYVSKTEVAAPYQKALEDRGESALATQIDRREYRVKTEAEVAKSIEKTLSAAAKQQEAQPQNREGIRERRSKVEEQKALIQQTIAEVQGEKNKLPCFSKRTDEEKEKFRELQRKENDLSAEKDSLDALLRDYEGMEKSFDMIDRLEDEDVVHDEGGDIVLQEEEFSKQTDRKPLITEHFETREGTGLAESSGKRPGDSEDATCITTFNATIGGMEQKICVRGLFDGHGGVEVSQHASKNIVACLQKRLEEFSGGSDCDISNALTLACVDLSRGIYAQRDDGAETVAKTVGSTANISLIIGENVWVANLGDSRAVVVDKDGAKQVSEDATVSEQRYAQGLVVRGGEVIAHKKSSKVGIGESGAVAVVRALGDHHLMGAISARPKITKYTLPEGDEARKGMRLVQCCDGVFDVMTTGQVGDLVSKLASKGHSEASIASQIVRCAFEAGSTDNITALVTPLFV